MMLNSLITSVESAITMKADVAVITNKATTSEADVGLLSIVMDIVTAGSNIDTKDDIIASMEGHALPGYGIENRLAKLGNYIMEGLKRIFKMIRKFVVGDTDKLEAVKIQLLEITKSESTDKVEGKFSTTNDWIARDGKIKHIEDLFETQQHIVSDLTSHLNTALVTMVKKSPSTEIDKVGRLDSLSDTIRDVNKVKYTLIDILLKSNRVKYGESGEIELTMTETRNLKLSLGNVSIDDIDINEKLKAVTTFNTQVTVSDPESVEVPYLSPDDARKQSDILMRVMSKLSSLYQQYSAELDSHEKLLVKQVNEIPANVGDQATVEKAREQLRLAIMKIHSRVYTPVFHNLVTAVSKQVPYLQACVK